MANESEYYKEKKKKQIIKLRKIQEQLPNYVINYLDDKELTSQINTVVAYAYDLVTFFNFLKEKNSLLKNTEIKDISINTLEQLTFEDINEYQKYLTLNDPNNKDESKHLNGDKGIARRMAPLRGFFLYMVERKLMKNNPTVGAAKRRKMPKKDIQRLTPDEVNKLLNNVACTNLTGNNLQIKKCEKTQLRDLTIFTLLLNTGIRVSECVGLNIDDINFDNGTINIIRKGGNQAHLYLNDETKDLLKEYINTNRKELLGETSDEPALFISLKRSRMSVSAIERMIKKFTADTVSDKSLHPHLLRKSFGTALYNSTGDIRLVADSLGHTDINTTSKHYAAIEDDHRKIAATVKLY